MTNPYQNSPLMNMNKHIAVNLSKLLSKNSLKSKYRVQSWSTLTWSSSKYLRLSLSFITTWANAKIVIISPIISSFAWFASGLLATNVVNSSSSMAFRIILMAPLSWVAPRVGRSISEAGISLKTTRFTVIIWDYRFLMPRPSPSLASLINITWISQRRKSWERWCYTMRCIRKSSSTGRGKPEDHTGDLHLYIPLNTYSHQLN